VRVFDVLIDFDCVREHALDTIEPGDQVARSGWVGFLRQICFDLLVGGDRIAFDDEAGCWSGGVAGIEPKQMSTGLARKSAMLSGKMTLSYGPPWAHYLGGYQDRVLGRPLGLLDLRCTVPDGVKHKDYRGEVLG
jgi:hypothetical protein